VIRPKQPPPPSLAPWTRFGIGPLDIRRHAAFSNVSVVHFIREDDESMKPPSKVTTPAQYVASLPADRAKTNRDGAHTREQAHSARLR